MEIIKYVLEFTFQDIVHFIGILMILGVIFGGIGQIGNKYNTK